MDEYLAISGDNQTVCGIFTPEDWAECDGKVLTITDHAALFSILGTQYGGDGKSTFALPNLHGHEPIQGTRYIICIQGVYCIRYSAARRSRMRRWTAPASMVGLDGLGQLARDLERAIFEPTPRWAPGASGRF